jgi:hypothetical protein
MPPRYKAETPPLGSTHTVNVGLTNYKSRGPTFFLATTHSCLFETCFYVYRYPSDKQQIITNSICSKDLTILKNAVCIPLLITDSALLQVEMHFLNDNES